MEKLILLLFMIATISLSAQDTIKVLLTFNEPMDTASVFNEQNYKMFSTKDTLTLYKIAYLKSSNLDSLTSVVMLLNPMRVNIAYTIEVTGVKDKAGNVIDPLRNTATLRKDPLGKPRIEFSQ